MTLMNLSFCSILLLLFNIVFSYYSCDRVAYLEERAYWKFTIWSFVIGAASSMAVMLRLRVLNYRAKRRARQVLSNGAI